MGSSVIKCRVQFAMTALYNPPGPLEAGRMLSQASSIPGGSLPRATCQYSPVIQWGQPKPQQCSTAGAAQQMAKRCHRQHRLGLVHPRHPHKPSSQQRVACGPLPYHKRSREMRSRKRSRAQTAYARMQCHGPDWDCQAADRGAADVDDLQPSQLQLVLGQRGGGPDRDRDHLVVLRERTANSILRDLEMLTAFHEMMQRIEIAGMCFRRVCGRRPRCRTSPRPAAS